MQVRTSLAASGSTHPGLVRDRNEDRFHYDPPRGIFIVIDGVGGQAAGEKAADTALRQLRERLEQESGPVEARIRQAITSANNEIYRLGSIRPEWKGMACVLTLVVLDGDEAVVGHVGDTRLYKIRAGRIEKATRDHSPVGEREDAGELSEADAMRHPRRNEVYRDVGSETHHAEDSDFIDVFRIPLENDAALLLCSDGLTDLVDSQTIRGLVEEHAGHPYEVVRALIEAANDAGGKDNVTVVYVEGSRFAQGEDTGAIRRAGGARQRREPVAPAVAPVPVVFPAASRGRFWRRLSLVTLLVIVLAWSAYQQGDLLFSSPTPPPISADTFVIVEAGQSIAAAIAAARPGAVVLVEPGEYRERLVLRSGVQVRSRIPRGVAIRLPTTATEADAAILAQDVSDAEVRGLRIVGDSATPLGIGVLATHSNLQLIDVEISGARTAAVIFGAGATGALLAGDLHDNPGVAIDIRSGAEPRIVSNTLTRNATFERTAGTMILEAGARPDIRGNIFVGVTRQAIVGLDPAETARVAALNWFVPGPSNGPARGNRQGRPGRP